MTKEFIAPRDGDLQKGAIESQSPGDKPVALERDGLADQLPHRNMNELLDGQDSDFPEPGLSPEHTGQHS